MTSPCGVVNIGVVTCDVGSMVYNVVCDVAASSKTPDPEAAPAADADPADEATVTRHDATNKPKTAKTFKILDCPKCFTTPPTPSAVEK